MFSFKLSVLELRGIKYMPLPKLSGLQMRFLEQRLRKKGFVVQMSGLIHAQRRRESLRVDPDGLCWSRTDPSDAIAPAIPELLDMRRKTSRISLLRALYFGVDKGRDSTSVRFLTRLESSNLWKTLRSAGGCGLTPDEREIILMVIGSSPGRCTLLTDFPTEGSKVRIVGRRQYYESWLDHAEASSTLRVVGEVRERNSYLPKGGTLNLQRLDLPSASKQAAFFDRLGGWCYLRPKFRESSNC